MSGPRVAYNFDAGWKVLVGDAKGAEATDFDDETWKAVTLPYAWNEDDAFRQGIKDLSTGIAWYRKRFTLPPNSGKQKVFLEFEGIRQASEFYLNGQFIGRRDRLAARRTRLVTITRKRKSLYKTQLE
jgi:beta-galactosidase/beta-glucuronidase